MNQIAETFKDRALFLIIYVSEAHASDEWPLGTNVCIPKHKTIEERIEVAKKNLVEERSCKIPVLVDSMDDSFEGIYKGWPERYYIIRGRTLKLIGEPSNEGEGFDRTRVSWWLLSNLSEVSEVIDK